MAFMNAEDKQQLAALEFRQRIRRFQIQDLIKPIERHKNEGRCAPLLERKVQQMREDLAKPIVSRRSTRRGSDGRQRAVISDKRTAAKNAAWSTAGLRN
jgi:hypothetical protein